MEAVKENVTEVKKKKIWPWILVSVLVLAAAGAAALWYFRPQPLVLDQAYVAADLETAPIYYYEEESTTTGEMVRGTLVTFVVEEPSEEHPDMVRLVMESPEGEEVFEDEATFAWIKTADLVDDPSKVVLTEKVYANMTMNLYDEVGYPAPALVEKGEELKVIGFDGLTEKGFVERYIVEVQRKDGTETGYMTANYVCRTQEESTVIYNEKLSAIHAKRGDPYDGGDAKSLDYSYREKGNFPDNVMPKEVKALYLNNEFIPNVDTYLKIAKGSGINAFVIDIQDGGAVGYASPTMEKYSPSAYKAAWNGLEEYRAAVKKIKDAGYYVIGRITTFNDPYFAKDHPENLIANAKNGKPLEIGGMYWPSAYQRYVWQYKVDLALEAVELMGFNEIQFDYVRFPDGTWWYDDDEIDYRNTYGETKAQAIQRFLIYAADKLHAAGAYISADVFGETSLGYVCAYGQYWPAMSNVVDAISAMPYPDHYGASGDWLPWEHPYDVLYSFGSTAADRQKETPCPAAVRTWIQAYSAIHEPYTYYGPNQIAAQIKALRDTGNTGGYMTWNAASSIEKYYDIQSALN